MKQHRSLFLLSVASMCVALLGACGDDDASPTDGGTHDAASQGGGATSGGGATDGSAAGHSGGGGGTGGVGSGQVASVKCGTATCTSPAQAAGFITACCADEATSTCGNSMMGSACAKPVPNDSRCPPLTIMGFIMLASCCTTDGMCGIDASMFNMPGCVELGDAAERAMSDPMATGIEFPPPSTCDDVAVDAGADDTAADDAGAT